jgi:hypothetical protein
MKKLITILLFISGSVNAQTSPMYSVACISCNFAITCATPTANLAVYSGTMANTFSVQGMPSIPSGTEAAINSPGSYTLVVSPITMPPGPVLIPVAISLNTTLPVSSLSSTFQSLSGTQTPQAVSITAVSPTVNITHFVYSPLGGTVTANSHSITYLPGSPGTYTHCIVDDLNGCISCTEFTISLNNGTGLVKESLKNRISIFPNPAREFVYVQGTKNTGESGRVSLEIVNFLGQSIRQEDIDPDKPGIGINVEAIPNGVYILKLKAQNNTETISRRFVINH